MIVTLFTTTQFYKENLDEAYRDETSTFGEFLRYYVKILNVDTLTSELYNNLLETYKTFPLAEVVQGASVSRLTGSELTSWIDSMRQKPLEPRVLDDEEEDDIL